jgi:hypothetical protein
MSVNKTGNNHQQTAYRTTEIKTLDF